MRRCVVAALAVPLLATACASSGRPPMSVSTIAGRPAPGTAPAGTKPVTFHGLTIHVPTSWAVTPTRGCDRLRKSIVLIGDGVEAACLPGPPTATEATFDTWRPGSPDQHLRRRAVTIDGHDATVGTSNDSRTTELIVPDIMARLIVNGRTAAIGARLVRTAEITQTDVNGCPSTAPYVDLTAPPTSGPADTMVAEPFSTVVICRYLSTYLEQGVTLSLSDATKLVDTLNALPTGLSEAPRKLYSPELCRGAPSHARLEDYADEEALTLRISHPHAPLSLVYVRLSVCGALGFTNGTRTGQRTDPATELIAKLSGVTSWQGGVQPR